MQRRTLVWMLLVATLLSRHYAYAADELAPPDPLIRYLTHAIRGSDSQTTRRPKESATKRKGTSISPLAVTGAAVGALVVSTVVIPVAGLPQTCLLLSVVALGGLALSSVAFVEVTR